MMNPSSPHLFRNLPRSRASVQAGIVKALIGIIVSASCVPVLFWEPQSNDGVTDSSCTEQCSETELDGTSATKSVLAR